MVSLIYIYICKYVFEHILYDMDFTCYFSPLQLRHMTPEARL